MLVYLCNLQKSTIEKYHPEVNEKFTDDKGWTLIYDGTYVRNYIEIPVIEEIVDNNNNCLQCDKNYYLGSDNKCSYTKNCEASKNGLCVECKEKYYLGLDHICTNIEHCIYSEDYICIEYEDNYYYDQNSMKCQISN